MIIRRVSGKSARASDEDRGELSAGLAAALLATVLVSLVVGGCAPAVRPNVIVISIDTLRADRLGCYGHERETSPRIDRLAANGVLFENAFSPTAWTLPGHASLFSGLRPRRHGAVRAQTAIRQDVPLLAEILKEHGYATAAVVNAPFLQAKFGFDRGFDTFTYTPKLEVARHQQAVLETLRSVGGGPFFHFFHYMSVHDPYTPEEPYNRFVGNYEQPIHINGEGLLKLWRAMDRGETQLNSHEVSFLDDLYSGGVSSVDARIGEILDLLETERLDDDTIVILTSDHGEEFMEHGSILHTKTLYDELLRVPLIVSGPGVPDGLRVRSMASLIDVMPTVLRLLQIPVPGGLDGVDLAPYWSDDSNPRRLLDIETSWVDGTRASWGVRTSEHKLIVNQETGYREFYDLTADPGEKRNLYPHSAAEPLERWLNRPLDAAVGGEVQLTPADLEQLKALGYIQ